MKIILNKDVQNLGEEGDVKEVAPGYARNYLFPKGLGVAYTKQNLSLLEGKRKAIEKRKAEKKEHALGVKGRIESLDLEIPMTVGENGRLFGSVTNSMLAEELAKQGMEVERKRIEIPEHTIKTTGNFVVKVKLYGNEVASLKVRVTGPQAEPAAGKAKKAETGEAVAEAPQSEAVEAEAPQAEVTETDSAETEAAEAEAAAAETGAAEPAVAETEAAETEVEADAESGSEPAEDESAEASDEEPTDEK